MLLVQGNYVLFTPIFVPIHLLGTLIGYCSTKIWPPQLLILKLPYTLSLVPREHRQARETNGKLAKKCLKKYKKRQKT
jgi:hypothetical protein